MMQSDSSLLGSPGPVVPAADSAPAEQRPDFSFPEKVQGVATSELISFLDERQIDGAFRDELLSLQPREILAVIRLVRALRPSENTLRELFHVCREIAIRDGVLISDILAHPDITTLLANDCQLSRKERKRRIDELLNRRRFPETTRIREELSSCVRQLATDVGLRIVVPEDLEGDTVQVTVQLSGPGDAATVAEKFAALSAHDGFPQLFRLLRGSL